MVAFKDRGWRLTTSFAKAIYLAKYSFFLSPSFDPSNKKATSAGTIQPPPPPHPEKPLASPPKINRKTLRD